MGESIPLWSFENNSNRNEKFTSPPTSINTGQSRHPTLKEHPHGQLLMPYERCFGDRHINTTACSLLIMSVLIADFLGAIYGLDMYAITFESTQLLSFSGKVMNVGC